MERVLKWMINPNSKNGSIFEEGNTFIEIEDITGGEFIVVSQEDDEYHGKLAFEKEEWEYLKVIVDKAFETINTEGIC